MAGSALLVLTVASMVIVRLSGRSFWPTYWIAASALTAAGAGAAATGAARIALRARWLDRLRRPHGSSPGGPGEEPGRSAFDVEARPPSAEEAGLPLMFRSSAREADIDGVLVARGHPGDLSYREHGRAIPVALVQKADAGVPGDFAVSALRRAGCLLVIGAFLVIVLLAFLAMSLA